MVHFFYPHICIGCGSDIIEKENFLCLECINDLPHTDFATHANNPVEKIFWGRIPITSGMSEFYFSKDSIIQNCIHELKYRGNKKIGLYLGKIMGKSLLNSNRFSNIDFLIPLPLFTAKEFKRGFNQSSILCSGIKEVINIPVVTKNVIRIVHTETQTKKGRIQRWENVEKSFSVIEPSMLKGKHVLLVDDVITTGATIEACGTEILKIEGVQLSIASLAISKK
ncbi:MAG TPA: phosphoribosyltransferase family protein [Ginsengibacter sp.]|nr:phosphoribosyltransferase family protein [Ginsengibacter sp.]